MDRLKKAIVALAVVLIALFAYISHTPGDGRSESAVVTRVVDGDTLVIEGGERVRLLGMDTQESGKPCYETSKERLEELVLKKTVRIERNGEDQYGRTLAYVFLDGTLINRKLVEEGLAVAYFYEEGGKYMDSIKSAEQEAMESNRGCEWS